MNLSVGGFLAHKTVQSNAVRFEKNPFLGENKTNLTQYLNEKFQYQNRKYVRKSQIFNNCVIDLNISKE